MSTEAPAAAPPAPTATNPTQEDETTHTHQEPSQPRVAPAHQESTQPQPRLPPRPAQSHYQQYPNAYGQPFQTYQQYGAATAFPGQQNAPTWSALQGQIPSNAQVIPPPPVVEKKSWIISKMALHGIGFIFGVVVLALGITFVNDNFFSAIMLIMNCIVGALAIIWSAAELIVRAANKLHPGIHPGAHVALCLIIWLAAAVVGGIQATLAWQVSYYDYGYYRDCSYDYDPTTGTRNYNCDDSQPTGRDGLIIASAVFTWFLWAVYFVLFILACIDTHRVNAARHRPSMVVLQQPPQQGQWGPGQPQMVMAQPPNAYHPSLVPVGGMPRQSMQPQPRHSASHREAPRRSHLPTQHEHVASGAIPEEEEQVVVDKGKQPERADGQDGVREYYTPGTAV